MANCSSTKIITRLLIDIDKHLGGDFRNFISKRPSSEAGYIDIKA